ncbi:hypothetical protein QAD02_022597 [Eretmocerus hayati]|uniref:Uncharacterized protein n=1 Tax=Eretmocerus hayati TaxID=131215 RepID=A0ACC2PV25_9HYME|nr:hypothetical protein QAD02_022597 [Eretmocerus hayati]
MFRTKKDVDRHVQDIFRKLPDENERTLRCYKIAELYYNVGDYESARRYLSRYVETRKEAKALKLMGQILESLGQKEAALIQYKLAFELDGRQEDLILKVCELMAAPDIEIDVNRAKHWSERADELFPRHKIVFELKEKMLSLEKSVHSEEDLEKLILAELVARPTDVQLRVKLLKYYIEKGKLDEAYKHATDVEETSPHRDSTQWYQILCELFSKCKSSKESNWSFWIYYISALERHAALSLKEQGCMVRKTSEAMQAVYNFDQILFEAKAQSFSNYPSLTEGIFAHMWGQLQLHMACLVLQNTKRENSSWSETGRLCTPLLLAALHVKPIDLSVSWAIHVDRSLKNLLQLWYKEGSYRCSQAGHILHDYARGNPKKLTTSIEKFCSGSWRERVYQRIFVGKIYQKIRTSYFANNNAMNPPFRLASLNELKKFDEVAALVWPHSLHHQIWPALKTRNRTGLHSNSKYDGPQPNLSSPIFHDLQFSVYNLNQASPVTLSRLDVDAFLNVAVLCASAVMEEQCNNLLDPDRLPTLPADLTSPLCSEEQEKWWSAAFKSYSKEVIEDIGENRQVLQRGLEVIRCIGNHGLHPVVLVHLARIFNHRAKVLKEKHYESANIPALEARSELYWAAAVPLLERLQNNQNIRSSHSKLFEYIGKDMNNMELTHAIEEGKLALAQKFVRDKLYEQAIEALQALKCPEASFEQGKIYKLLADETMNSSPKESVTSEMRHLYFSILSKARNSFYLTLDRLRSPDADPKHPLNAELCIHITSIENELKRIDPDMMCNDRNRNECDDLSEESYSSAHSEEHAVVTNSLPMMNNTSHTPMRSIRRSIRHSTSTPRQHHDFLDTPRNRNEARPSPERLDAQIRQLVHSIDSLKEFMITRIDEQNKTVISKLDELIKVTRHKDSQKPSGRPQVHTQNIEDELYAAYSEDDYRDFNSYSHASLPGAGNTRASVIPPNLFAPRQPYSPLMYPQGAALQGYYQGAPLPFPDPAAAVAAAAAAAVQPMSGLYPNPYQMPMYRHGFEQPLASMQHMTQDVLQQGLFSQRPDSQLPDSSYPSAFQMNSLKETPRFKFPGVSDSVSQEPPSLSKDNTTSTTTSSTQKLPPVNVVITTSDTLPSSTTSSTQPTLSVTIPVQHRLGMPLTSATSLQDPSTPHSYQISMPSQATIPTTVILPPLATTLTITSPLSKSHDNHNTSAISTSSIHSSSDAAEVEHDPIPDFAPIIPLPDEVPVTTGEEDEETLFCARARLFRFVDKEWKERGVGNVKLLKNKEGKIRLLMRREQVHKICANHMLRKDMQLTVMPTNEKAYIWVANDFADEEIKLEKLCIRFKTVEEGASFKEHFDKAKDSLPDETVKANEMTVTGTTKAANEPTKTDSAQNKPTGKIGGFSFTSSPIIQKPVTQDETPKKPEEATAKPSPFASFSFVKPSDSTNKMPTTPVFSFGTPTSTASAPVISTPDSTASILRRPNLPASSNTTSNAASTAQDPKPLSELFKPAPGSWECKDCYTRNNQSSKYCVACEAPPASTNTTSNAASTTQAPKPLSELFKPAPGSWACNDCYTRNNQSSKYCVACEAPSDPSLPPKPKVGGLTSSTGSASNFNFGIPQGQTSASVSNDSGFRFNAQSNTSEKTTSSPANIFGANKPSGFNFGIQAPSTPPHSGSGSYTFGSPGKGFDFQFQNKSSAVKPPERLEVSDDDVVEESEDVYFAPVIPLPDKVEVKTGEEDEEVLYSHRAKLFKFDSSTKEWKERGLGDIKLLRHVQTKKLRLVMRRDQILKLCLNHAVSSSVEITSKDDKTWMWSAGDYSEGEVEYMQFACRFKSPEVANEFKKAVDDACKSESNSESPSSVPNAVKTTVKTVLKESSPDVQIVYEVKVTPEEKAAAKKLLLPENFYSYKYKPDCAGCIGCRDSDGSNVTETLNKEETPKISSSNSVFSFGKPTSTSSATSLSFGTPTSNIFSSPKNSDKVSVKAPSFSLSKVTATASESQGVLENLKICSPPETSQTPTTTANASPPPKNIFGGFGVNNSSSAASNNVFSSPTTASNSNKNTGSVFSLASNTSGSIFGGAKSVFDPANSTKGSMFGGTNIFGGQANTTPSFGSLSSQANAQGSNPFGFGSSTASKPTDSSMSALDKVPVIGGNDGAAATGSLFGSKPAWLGSGNIFGGKPVTTSENDKTKQETGLNFLPTENTLTFSALAAQTQPNQKPAFERDPDFTFDGAGASVFGSKPALKAAPEKVSSTASNTKKDNAKDNDEEDGDGETENGEEHDPYFEPIVPLPDAIEVRTGEEEEEKVFCERGKLYRYDQTTKEWKERGTGEMKLLHHVQHGTYRLLLRREQVHKIVCNLLVTADLEFRELNSSDRAWMWAAMNYAEPDNPEVEQLAIRFKTPELAQNFKQAVDKAQLATASRQMFEKHATVYVQTEGGQKWDELTSGTLKVLYDSEIFGARIVAESDSKDIVSDTVISMDSSMQCVDKQCSWSAIDYAVDPPVRRNLKAVFPSAQTAQEMYQTFQEGKDYASKADIRE